MKKQIIIIFIIALTIYVVLQWQNIARSPGSYQPPPPTRDTLMDQVEGMTLEEKVGQLIIVGMDGTVLNNDIKNLVVNHHAGGVILYKKNITSSNQLLNLLNQLKTANNTNNIPLFLSIDEEGGRVSRLPDELESLPTSRAIGEVDSKSFSYQIGQTLAAQLEAYGFNLNFAPVLDINSNPQNQVIGDRSFGNNPDVVSRLGVETIKGLQNGGVIPVAKHFPGHGDTLTDSHIGLPSVTHDMARLRNFELLPFQAAINNQVDAIMVAHILLSELDDDYPASMSYKIITELLREELQFRGLVVTDDMTMGAIVEHYLIDQAAVQAVKAGSDLVLVCHDYESQLAVFAALKDAVAAGTIPEEQINNSVYKVLQLKQKYNLSDQPVKSVDVTAINAKINNLLDTFMRTAP